MPGSILDTLPYYIIESPDNFILQSFYLPMSKVCSLLKKTNTSVGKYSGYSGGGIPRKLWTETCDSISP